MESYKEYFKNELTINPFEQIKENFDMFLLDESITVDPDEAYEIFKKEYIASTGHAWNKEKFMNRIYNWTFYGTPDGFVALRPQNSGFYKLVAAAGNMKGKYKGLLEIVDQHLPVWGIVTADIRDILKKKGFREPNFIERMFLKKFLKDKILSNNEFVGFSDDGGLILNIEGMGQMIKYMVGSPEYWQKLYSMKEFMQHK